MRGRIALLLLMTAPATVTAADVSLSYENFFIDPDIGRARIIVKLTNQTARDLETVIVHCAFLGESGKALDTTTLIATNVLASTHAYADGWSSETQGIKQAECRVTNAN